MTIENLKLELEVAGELVVIGGSSTEGWISVRCIVLSVVSMAPESAAAAFIPEERASSAQSVVLLHP